MSRLHLVVGVLLLSTPLLAQERDLPPAGPIEPPGIEAAGSPLAPPSEKDRQTIQAVIKLLAEHHISAHPLDDEIGERALSQFIDYLDPGRWYFTQQDVAGLQRKAYLLDDQLRAGDFSLALEIHRLFGRRVNERIALAEQLLEQEHDFTVDERLALTGRGFARDEAAVRELWRQRVKYELLTHKSAGADDEEARRRAARAFRDMLRRSQQMTTSDIVALQADALAHSYDSQTAYIAPANEATYASGVSGQIVGIGLSLQDKSGYVTVITVVPNGPAARDGTLKPGDRLAAVAEGSDGPWKDIVGVPLAEAVNLIRGARGSKVRLRFFPPGELEASHCTLTRDSVEVTRIGHHIFNAEQLPEMRPAKLGYIYLPLLYRGEGAGTGARTGSPGVTVEVERRLAQLASEGVDLVVLDLRDNTGGSLTEAVNLPGLFLGSAGDVVQVKGRDGKVITYKPENIKQAWRGPLVVLTGRASSGGAEIIAGAIQDTGRGLIAGAERTQGGGTVGQILNVTDRSVAGGPGANLGQMKIIKEKFYRPTGFSIQLQGIAVDVPIPTPGDIYPDDESKRPYALRFDRVQEATLARHEPAVGEAVIREVAERSAQRVKESPYFQELSSRVQAAAASPVQTVSLKLDTFLEEQRKSAGRQDAPSVPGIAEVKLDDQLQELLRVSLDFASRDLLARGDQSIVDRKFQAGIDQYRRAVACDPQFPRANYKLAWALATCPVAALRDGAEATKLAQRACELDQWQSWQFILALAVAEAEAGNFANATTHLKTALDAAPAEQRSAYANLEDRFRRRQTFASGAR